MTPPTTPARTYTTQEAANLLGISPSRVRRIAHARHLGRHLGPVWRFSPADLDAMRVRVNGRPRKARP